MLAPAEGDEVCTEEQCMLANAHQLVNAEVDRDDSESTSSESTSTSSDSSSKDNTPTGNGGGELPFLSHALHNFMY